MKKLWMLLIALALLVTAVPMFASDVTFSGRMIWWANYDTEDGFGATAGLNRFRPKLTAKIDDFTTLVGEFRMDDAIVLTSTGFDQGVNVQYAYVTSDITGALGLDLPVTINATMGKFEPGFTDWSVTEAAFDFYRPWPNKIADVGPFATGGGQLDIGFGPAALHVFSDFLGFMMFGLSGGFGPVSGWLTYQAPVSGLGDGILGVEARYAGEFGDLKLTPLAYFRYELADPTSDGFDYVFGVSAAVDYGMFHLAAGFEGDSVDAFDQVEIDVGVKPVENLGLKANTFLDLATVTDNALVGIDLQVNYMMGAAKWMLGYVIAGEDRTALKINGDSFAITNGLYLAVDVSF